MTNYEYQELEKVTDKIYKRGYDDGKKSSYAIIDEAHNDGYAIGAKDAWQTAKCIMSMPNKERLQWFGVDKDSVFEFEAKEAMDRWNLYVISITKGEIPKNAKWYDIPAEEMNEEQLRTAVRELRKRVMELKEGEEE